MKYYHCSECNQIVFKGIDSHQTLSCCGLEMIELEPNNEANTLDEHFIHIRKIGNFVTITVQNHPVLDIHHIQLIALETNQGFQYKYIQPNQTPKAEFILAKNEEIMDAYTLCNVHLLFK